MRLIRVTVHHIITHSGEGTVNLADADVLRGAVIHRVTQQQFTVIAFMVWRTEMFVFSRWFRHLQGNQNIAVPCQLCKSITKPWSPFYFSSLSRTQLQHSPSSTFNPASWSVCGHSASGTCSKVMKRPTVKFCWEIQPDDASAGVCLLWKTKVNN